MSEQNITPKSSPPFNLHKIRKGRKEVAFWGGISFDSPAGKILGHAKNRQFIVGSVNYGLVFAASNHIAVEYVLNIIPVAVVTNNPDQKKRLPGSIVKTILTETEIQRIAVYGFGVSPVGMRFYFWQKSRLKLFLNGSGGILFFSHAVPEPKARKFNFTFDFGAGLQIYAHSDWAFTLGYKFHHLSNANTAPSNPGLDANLFYFGVSRFL